MKVTIRRCDFCGEYIPEGEDMLLVGKIESGNWEHHADMCKKCFEVLTNKAANKKEEKGDN